MGFWRRLLNRDQNNGIADAAAKLRKDDEIPTPVDNLLEDPRERARALGAALELASSFGFSPKRDILVDDVPFDRLGGIEAFAAERLTTLLNLTAEEEQLFPRVLVFEYDFVDSNDAYDRMLREMAEATGTMEQFEDIHCDLHFGPDFQRHPMGEFHYTCNGTRYTHGVSSEGDWADPAVVVEMFARVTPADMIRVTADDSGHNYWVPKDLAERFRTILAAEELAARKRRERWRASHQR